MGNKRKVVVTGMGVLTPLGNNKNDFWKGLESGTSGIFPINSFDTGRFKHHLGGEIKDFEPRTYFEKRELQRMDPASQMALAALQEAVDDAHLDFPFEKGEKCGVILGTTLGGMISGEKYYRQYKRGRYFPSLLLDFPPYSVNDRIAVKYNIRGPNMVISTACAAGTHSLGFASDLIKFGKADIIIAGGYDTMAQLTFTGFGILSVLSKDKIRPFDKNRNGTILGEGAGILILEEYEHAVQREARIYCEIAGHGMSSDAFHMTAPDKEGMGAARAIKQALSESGISPGDIDYINAHGTGTKHNDLAETLAIKKVFCEHAYKIPVSSIKSMIGHTLGAAGSIEAVATILSMKKNFIPPTINYETPDPSCDLDFVPNNGRKKEISYALSNSFGFGGNNGSLLIKKIAED